MTMLEHGISPVSAARSILRLNTAYSQARVLHSAVEVGLFSLLSEGPASASEICARLRLQRRIGEDFLDTLAGIGLLERSEGSYRNSPEAAEFLVPGQPAYLGGSITQHSRVHYHLWARLTEALRDGKAKSGADLSPGAVRDDEQNLDSARRFLSHMDVFNSFVAPELARCIDWRRYQSFADIGGARGNVAAKLVLDHPHLTGHVFDVAGVEPLFDEHMRACGLAGQVLFHGGDFFADPLPVADVLVVGHVLHDWPVTARRELIARAYPAIRPGGLLLIYDAMLADDRRDPHALLQSLNCRVIRDGGSEYTVADCRDWVEQAGFRFDQVIEADTLTCDRVLIAVKMPAESASSTSPT